MGPELIGQLLGVAGEIGLRPADLEITYIMS